MDNRTSVLTTTTQGVSYIASIRHELWSTTGPPFLPTLRKFCFLLHCQASQTDTSKRNLTKLWQTVALNRVKICHRAAGRPVPDRIGAKKLLYLFNFSMTSRLNGEYLLNETWYSQSRKGVWRVSYVVSKFNELWSTNGLKPDRRFYPPSLFCSVPVHRTPSKRH